MERLSAKGIVAVTLVRLFLMVALVGAPLLILWRLADGLERGMVNTWAALVTASLVPAFLVGFWFGKVEARGFLSGIDTSLDKMASSVSKIDDVVSRRTRREKQPQPNINIYSDRPVLPAISHRRLTNEDEVIDL